MLVDNDAGARRNRSDANGLWLINLLVSMLVAVLSLYVFRAEDARRDARVMMAGVAAMPGQLTTTPAMAAPRAKID